MHCNCLYLSSWLSCWRLWEESHIFTFGPFLRGRVRVSVFKSFSSVSCFPARLDAAGERLAEAALSCGINRKLRAALNQRTAVRYETLSSGPCSAVLSGRQVASGSSDCSGAGSGSAFGETHPSVRRNSRNAVLGWKRIPRQ